MASVICADGIGERTGSTSLTRRLGAAIVCLAIGSLFALAGALTPAGEGLGTHESLGLPPCSVYAYTGRPCPSCGYTTAFSHLVRGHVVTAFVVQPAGALLALTLALTWVVSLAVLITGWPVYRRFAWLWHHRTLWAVAAIVLGAWIYKIIIT